MHIPTHLPDIHCKGSPIQMGDRLHPMGWQPVGNWNPAAWRLTDSKAVVELEAAEYLVNISCMIKAIASYHNLKGFCK